MSGIDTYLQQILNGRYGRDVRQAIHDAFEKTYDDATAAGNANAEVAAARGTFANLKARLDDMTSKTSSNTTSIGTNASAISAVGSRVTTLENVSPSSRKVFDTYTDAHTGWVALSYSVAVPIGSVLLFNVHDRDQSKYHCVVAQFYNTGTSFVQNIGDTSKLYVDFQSVNHCNVKLTGFTGGAAVFRIVKLL